MTTDERDILAILAQTATHLAAIRTADNEEDQDQYQAAHESMARLFGFGMIDRWRDDEGEEQPSPEDWEELNAEALEPGEHWSESCMAQFHRVCGDLNFLHSNDAGLNAALSNYEQAAARLREQDPVAAAICTARMLRAAAYASYFGNFLWERIEMVAAALQACDSAPPLVRDEIELSIVETTKRLQSFPQDEELELADVITQTLETFGREELPAELLPLAENVCALLRSRLHALCARSEQLPFRRSIPWIAVAEWAGTPILPQRHLAPFHALAGTSDLTSLVLYCLERAQAVEDGTFYPHGGALSPSQYIAAANTHADRLRLTICTRLGHPEAIATADRLLAALSDEDYDDGDRALLAGKRVLALYAAGRTEEARSAAIAWLDWLGVRTGEYWWTLSGLSDLLLELSGKAEELGHDDVVAEVGRIRDAQDDADPSWAM